MPALLGATICSSGTAPRRQEQQGRPQLLVKHQGDDKVKMEIKSKRAQRTFPLRADTLLVHIISLLRTVHGLCLEPVSCVLAGLP